MKRTTLSMIAAASLISTGALAESPTVMIGLSFAFGASPQENFGISGKVISNNEPENFILGAGGTYYPFSREQFGVDISAGYLTDNAAVTAGYDFLRSTPLISGGFVPTKKD